jgi:peptidoglycan-associated lipoprotein
MMKRNLLTVVLIALVFSLSVTFLTGCAKKAGLREGAAMTAVQPPSAPGPAKAAPKGEAAAGEKGAVGEGAAKGAAVAAKPAAPAKAQAIPSELQIPDINFDFDKYNLKPLAQTTLKNGAPAYLKYKDYKLVIEGHCDERGTAEYNLALGQKRADEAAKYLADLGIEKERIKTISYGKEMPLDKGHDEAAWAKNRRDHFVVFPPVK